MTMKRILLTILILGLAGTAGNCEVAYDSVLVCDTAWWTNNVDTGSGIHCWYESITYDPTVSLTVCCTVFVPVPCTVWVFSDFLFKQKWDAFDAVVDSVLMEMK